MKTMKKCTQCEFGIMCGVHPTIASVSLVKEELSTKGGKKFDKGKPRVSLIPTEVISGLAEVLTFGAEKYGDLNWTKGIEYSRLIDATNRHLLKFQSGIDLDEESGKSHLLHCMANLTFLYWMSQNKKEFDDRWENGSLSESSK